jgi:hypothetical protein
VKLFRLTDLRADDYVEVHVTEGQPGTLSASALERDNTENRSHLGVLQADRVRIEQ